MVVLFALGIQFVAAQTFTPAAQTKDPKSNLYPVMKDQSYSTIINTNASKADMMKTIKDYVLAYEFVTPDMLEEVEFDENMSELRFPIYYFEGQSIAKGMMGMAYVNCPIVLKMDAIFDFNNEGQMMLTLTNFSGAIYAFVDDNKVINKRKESRCVKQYGELINEYDKKITDEYSTILTLNTGIGKALLSANGISKEDIANMHQEFNRKRANQFEMYQQAVQKGSTELITEEDIVNYHSAAESMGKNQKEIWMEQANNYSTGNWVLGMNQYRWNNDFQDFFNMVFREFAILLNGDIESIALDGNIMYEQADGKVLPVDPKERKKWIKKGYSL